MSKNKLSENTLSDVAAELALEAAQFGNPFNPQRSAAVSIGQEQSLLSSDPPPPSEYLAALQRPADGSSKTPPSHPARATGRSRDPAPTGLSPRRLATLDEGFGPLGGLPRPFYPEQARRLGRSGSVVLDILVGPDGKVMRVKVVSESQGWGFGAAAREAYAKTVFTPPRVNGRPVRVLWRKTLRFRP